MFLLFAGRVERGLQGRDRHPRPGRFPASPGRRFRLRGAHAPGTAPAPGEHTARGARPRGLRGRVRAVRARGRDVGRG